jgi:peptidoglycan/xylan/chitin deacetylase (PgdA/CDA1 family)
VGSYRSDFAHGLMFHRFHRSGTPPAGQGSLTEVEFEELLNIVGPARILTPQEWVSRVASNSLQDSDLCITLDDGLRSQFDVALSVLDRYKLKAFWFVFSSVFEGHIDRNEVYNRFASTAFKSFDCFVEEFFQFYSVPRAVFESNGYQDFNRNLKKLCPFYTENDLKFRFVRNQLLDRNDFIKIMDSFIGAKGFSALEIARNLWLTNEHLKDLVARGHCIGLHSYDHPFTMAGLPEAKQEEQYARNFMHITGITGEPVKSMSHPLNSYNAQTIKVLSDLGIVCGFRSNMTPPLGGATLPALELAREDGVNILHCL